MTKKNIQRTKTKEPAPQKAPQKIKRSYTTIIEIAVIVLLCFLTYGNTIKNDYNFDDDYLVNDITKQGITAIPQILKSNYNEGTGVTYGYRPLGKVSMAIEYSLLGENVHYSHFINILLFALNVYLLLLFFRKIGDMSGFNNKAIIYIGILFFILHPIHTEVVASIKNREEILCFIFMLSALLCFIKLLKTSKYLYAAPIMFFSMLAYFSKESAVAIIGIGGLFLFIKSASYYEMLFQSAKHLSSVNKKGQVKIIVKRLNDLKYKILFCFALYIGMNAFLTFGNDLKGKGDIITQFEQNPYSFLYPHFTLLTSLETVSFYLKKLLVPFPLLFYYGYNMLPVHGWNTFFPYLRILLIGGLICFALFSIIKNKNLFTAFSILFTGITLFPVSNFFPGVYITGVVGERLCYQASAGFCMVFAVAISSFAEMVNNKIKSTPRFKLQYLIGGIIAVIFFIMTINRNAIWENKSTLFKHDIEFLSLSARANYLLSNRYMNELSENDFLSSDEKNLKLQSAAYHLHKALKVYPAYNDAWSNLGIIQYRFLSNTDSAFICFNKIDTANRFVYARAREYLGDISYNELKNKDLAKSFYLQGYKYMPERNVLYQKITQILFETGKFDSVIVFSDNGLRNNFIDAYIDKGDAYLNLKDTTAAKSYYKKAVHLGYNQPLPVNIY